MAKFCFVLELSSYVRLSFYQLYTVHIQVGAFFPSAFMFCSQQKEFTYNRFLETLISLIGDFVPKKNLIDFERAALNTFSYLYETEIEAGFFDLYQSFHHKFSELGVKKEHMKAMLNQPLPRK